MVVWRPPLDHGDLDLPGLHQEVGAGTLRIRHPRGSRGASAHGFAAAELGEK